MKGDLVLKEGKVYVLKDKELRMEIIWLHYNTPVVGHTERQKTTELVTRNYWWPGVTKDVGKYVEGCDTCQRMKDRMEAPAGKLMMNEVPKKVQIDLMIDFITKLLLVARKDAILVVCDRLSKMVHFLATTEETTAEGVVATTRHKVQRSHNEQIS